MPKLDWIRTDMAHSHFVSERSGERFIPWGFNYDHDGSGRLLEDYWEKEWPTVVEDFREMKALHANVVRVHLQIGKFMKSPTEPNSAALTMLSRLIKLAENTQLYLDITGLGCYHKKDVPAWYDPLSEAERWDVQARFWRSVAEVCAQSPAVFCYDLMNEPIIGGDGNPRDWLAGEFAGSFFVQRIVLDLAGRTNEQAAKQWVDKLAAAIHSRDKKHMITVGAIPWALVFPGAKPLFYAKEVSRNLDFVSVHFYPKKDEVDKALTALDVYRIGKPLVIEETFPLECDLNDLDAFIEGSRKAADGWIGFYWGKTLAEYKREQTPANKIMQGWLEYFRQKAPSM